MKNCAICKELKSLDSFTSCKKMKDGKGSYCKPCRKAKWDIYYKENLVEMVDKAKKWKEENPEKFKASHLKSNRRYQAENRDNEEYKAKRVKSAQKHYYKNIEKKKAYNKEYKDLNKEYFVNAAAIRRVCFKYSTLCKQFLKDCLGMYETCPEGHEVDHIIPLTHKDVCGLHVPWNLQTLPVKENSYKRNKFDGTYENTSWKDKP
jgi:5-methylcytosine-specific restriction endonuclease McrA